MGHGQGHSVTTGLLATRTTIRLTIRLERGVVPWALHKYETGASDGISAPLEQAGASDPATWYIVARAIPKAEWLEAVELSTGRVLWQAEHLERPLLPACDPIGPVNLEQLEEDLQHGYRAYAVANNDPQALMRQACVVPSQVNAARELLRDRSSLGQLWSSAAIRALCEQAESLPDCPKR